MRVLRLFRALPALLVTTVVSTSALAQKWEPPAIPPLVQVGIPDVNGLGLLDRTGPNANQAAYRQITNPDRKDALRRLGKALFWDMQVGGDGIQACASCHYHAGADHRVANQVSPHGPHVRNDLGNTQDLLGAANRTLTLNAYSPIGSPNRGLPVSQGALTAAGYLADAADGAPGRAGTEVAATTDTQDVVSSQGVQAGIFQGLSGSRVDSRTLATSDPGFDLGNDLTARRVPGRNSPSVVNAVYNLRNFWDGRAEAFFNGVNPLGFRDPDAAVRVAAGTSVVSEKLRIPFSSLASQAVGPIGSDVEMSFAGRSTRDLGRKLLDPDLVPLDGQAVSCSDSMLAGLTDCSGAGTNRGLTVRYRDLVLDIFDARFTREDLCVDAAGAQVTCGTTGSYSLMEYNFALFFGLAVQAYEATLTTEQTIVDLLVGGVATGTVRNVSGKNVKSLVVDGVPIDRCITALQFGTKAAQVAVAEALCTQHYAQFIHPKAVSGSESAQASLGALAANLPIGGCQAGARNAVTTNGTAACNAGTLGSARTAMLSVSRGLGRFFAGATGCGVCHANAEMSLASVSALTGFGKAPLPPLPAGQVRKVAPERVMERMAMAAGPGVYDTGFYNIGVRPTSDDWAQGDQIGGVPLSWNRLGEVLAGGSISRFPQTSLDAARIARVGEEIRGLVIPTSPTNLTPRTFPFSVACDPAITGQRNQVCIQNVVPGERLLHFGGFKTPQLRNAKFTGPYLHNGSKLNLRQVVEFYKTGGHFSTLNASNFNGGMKVFALNPEDEAALVEMMETGLTDWRLAHQEGRFDHPELCVPHGHRADGSSILVAVPAVGAAGGDPLQTFEEQLRGENAGRANTLQQACSMPGLGGN